jgi:hypothetical protein
MVGSHNSVNEPTTSTEGAEFLDQLNDYQLLKKGPAPCSQTADRK